MVGAPGAGKGTQAILLSAKYDIPHISTGDIFRANIKNNTELGKKAKEFMDQGLLVPDKLVVEIVSDRLKQEDCSNGYILDGFPRTIPQAKALDMELEKMESKIDYVINVEVPDEKIITRMAGRRVCSQCGETYHIKYNQPNETDICNACGESLIQRPDDEEKTVKKRLKVYHEQTQPLIDYYNGAKILVTVDGTQDVEEVTRRIQSILGA